MPLPETSQAPVVEKDSEPNEDNDLVANGAIPVSAPEQQSPDMVEQPTTEQEDAPPPDSAPSVAEEVQEPPVDNQVQDPPVSDFVKAQLERNRDKAGSATPPKEATSQKPTPENPVDKGALARSEPKSQPEATPSQRSGLRLQSLTLKPGGNSLTLEIEGSIPKAKFFLLSGPDRMVIDLPGNWVIEKQVPKTFQVNNDLVSTLRLGPNKGFLRVVFDLNTAQIQDPLFAIEGSKLTITLQPR